MIYKAEIEFFVDNEEGSYEDNFREALKAGAESTNTDLKILSLQRLPNPKPEPPKVLKEYVVTVRRREDAYCDIVVRAYGQKDAYDKAYAKIDDYYVGFETVETDYDICDVEELPAEEA